MSRVLVKFCGFALLQTIAFLGLIRFYDGGELPYFAAINAEHSRAEAAAGPRLFIAGGSSTPMAFDSMRIQEATGYQVTNLGLNGWLGLGFILNQALDLSHHGDVVILALEHVFFSRPLEGLYRFISLTNVLLVRPSSVKYLAWNDVKGVFDSGLLFLRNVIRSSWRRFVDHRSSHVQPIMTTQLGDRLVSPQAAARFTLPPFTVKHRLENSVDNIDAVIAKLNSFARECKSRGIQVYFFYGPYPEEYFQHNRQFLESVHRRLTTLAEFPILGDPLDTVAPAQLFLDTEYHVNPELRRQGHTAVFLERFANASQSKP